MKRMCIVCLNSISDIPKLYYQLLETVFTVYIPHQNIHDMHVKISLYPFSWNEYQYVLYVCYTHLEIAHLFFEWCQNKSYLCKQPAIWTRISKIS